MGYSLLRYKTPWSHTLEVPSELNHQDLANHIWQNLKGRHWKWKINWVSYYERFNMIFTESQFQYQPVDISPHIWSSTSMHASCFKQQCQEYFIPRTSIIVAFLIEIWTVGLKQRPFGERYSASDDSWGVIHDSHRPLSAPLQNHTVYSLKPIQNHTVYGLEPLQNHTVYSIEPLQNHTVYSPSTASCLLPSPCNFLQITALLLWCACVGNQG